uniref:Uncharacterized protein n=1 Tax=Moorena producens (strain JHB) TaxID=1454205 RepID=A0A1D9G844_MOOP1
MIENISLYISLYIHPGASPILGDFESFFPKKIGVLGELNYTIIKQRLRMSCCCNQRFIQGGKFI